MTAFPLRVVVVLVLDGGMHCVVRLRLFCARPNETMADDTAAERAQLPPVRTDAPPDAPGAHFRMLRPLSPASEVLFAQLSRDIRAAAPQKCVSRDTWATPRRCAG